jgi:hypothetical protein
MHARRTQVVEIGNGACESSSLMSRTRETQAVCKSRGGGRLSDGEAESITNALIREARRVKVSVQAAARPFDFDRSPLAVPQCAAVRTLSRRRLRSCETIVI